MEYKIHQLAHVSPANQQSFFEEEVRKKVARLQKILRDYPHVPLLEIFVKKEGSLEYFITATMTMRGKTLTAEEKGTQPVIVVNNVLDKLRGLLKKFLQFERKEFLHERKRNSQDLAENSKGE